MYIDRRLRNFILWYYMGRHQITIYFLQSTPGGSMIVTRRSSQSFAGMSDDEDIQFSSASAIAGGRNSGSRVVFSGSSSVSSVSLLIISIVIHYYIFIYMPLSMLHYYFL